MKASDLVEFEIEEEGLKLRMCRGTVKNCMYDSLHTQLKPASSSPVSATLPMPAGSIGTQKTVRDYEYIKSPMVGTFYRGASPESKPYASEGTTVNQKSIACIIEAMKVMNEIQAETNGIILEILVEDGAAVEFGQKLFKVKKS